MEEILYFLMLNNYCECLPISREIKGFHTPLESNDMIRPDSSSLNTSRVAPVAKIRQFIGIDDIPHGDVTPNVSNQMEMISKDTGIKTGNNKFHDGFHYSLTMNHMFITSTYILPTFTITYLHQPWHYQHNNGIQERLPIAYVRTYIVYLCKMMTTAHITTSHKEFQHTRSFIAQPHHLSIV